MQGLHFKCAYDGKYMIEDGCEPQKLNLFSRTVFFLLLLTSKSDPLCFSAHSGSNLQPEPGVIDEFRCNGGEGSGGNRWPTV